MLKIIIVNGCGGSGKTTFEEFVKDEAKEHGK